VPRRELNLYGIGVVMVAPAAVDTPIWNDPESAIGSYAATDYGEAFDKGVRAIVDAGRRHSLEASDVADAVMKALTARRPRLCYATAEHALLEQALRRAEGYQRLKGKPPASRAGMPLSERWRAAIYLGLISSTFSTIVSQLSAARIGRDAAVDWMSVAAIPARDWALSSEPSTAAIAIGIAFHQWADFSWHLRKMDGATSSGHPGFRRRPLGGFYLCIRVVRAGAVVSILAADLHIAAALLDRLSGPSFLCFNVPLIRLAAWRRGREATLRRKRLSLRMGRRRDRWNRRPGSTGAVCGP
jgi:hypothetical protein